MEAARKNDSVVDGILESNSLWYLYKTRVWLSDSHEAAAIHNTMRTLRSIHNSGTLAYASVPVTSGKYYYQCLAEQAKVDIQNVIAHNYDIGWKFTKDVVARRNCPVLYPGELVPARQKWNQDNFQSLWLTIIGEKCTEVHMSEDWEYSNGCSEEFTHAMQLKLGFPRHKDLIFDNNKELLETERERIRNIVVYDHLGVPLSIQDGVEKISRARGEIAQMLDHPMGSGEHTKKLDRCIELLQWTDQKIREGFYQ